MKISVIVSTYNQPRYLDLVLHGYGMQTDSNFDVIVADDGSGPETAEVIESHKERGDYPLSHVWHEDKGYRRYVVINEAISRSDADCLIFTDGDCIPKSNLVAAHRRLSRPGYYVTGNDIRLSREVTEAVTPEIVRSGEVFSLPWLMRRGGWRNYRIYRPRLYTPEGIGVWLDRVRSDRWMSYGRFGFNNGSCFRSDALAIDGFNENMVYGRADREFGIRLRNYGIKPFRFKIASTVLHLDHDRPYKNREGFEKNLRMIEEARNSGAIGWR